MKVVFKRSFRSYRKGQSIDVGDGEANVLIARGIAEPEQQMTLLETATAEQPELRTADVVKRKRGRPRKL